MLIAAYGATARRIGQCVWKRESTGTMKNGKVAEKKEKEEWHCVPISRQEMVKGVMNARWMEEVGDDRSVVERECRMLQSWDRLARCCSCRKDLNRQSFPTSVPACLQTICDSLNDVI